MQNVLLQRSILYTILHFTLFCAIATGCDWCKKSVDRSTNIHIGKTSAKIPQEKDALGATDKDENKKEEENGDEDIIKKKIEEELLAEQKRLKEEISLLKEKEGIATSNYIQRNSDNPQDEVQPSAPPFDSDNDNGPPPPYDSNWRHASTSLLDNGTTVPASNVCKACCHSNNHSFDEEDIKHILENPLTKLKIIEYRLKVTYKLRQKLKQWFKSSPYIHEFKDKKEKYERIKVDLKKEQEIICKNPALCSRHKVEKLEKNIIKMKQINYKIKDVDNIIAKIKGNKNNKSDESTNEQPPYQYDSTNHTGSLYPSLPDYS